VIGLLRYALRSLWARRVTTLATAGGIALLVFVLAASSMLASGMRRTLARAGDESRAIVIGHDQWAEHQSSVPASVLGRVAAAPGIRKDTRGQPLVTGETVTHLMLGEASKAHLSTLQIRGVDENVLALRPNVRVVQGRMLQTGTAEAIVGRGLVGTSPELAIGRSIELSVSKPATIVGVFDADGSVLESEIWVDLHTARSAFGMEGSLSSVTAQLDSPAAYDAFALPLTEDKQTGLDVMRESAYYSRLAEGVATVIITLGVLEALIFSLGAICATMIVFYGAVAQRRREVGVLRALGFRRRSILAAFLAESVVLSLTGGAAGMACALLTPLLDFHLVNFATGQDVTFHFHPDLDTLLRALLVATSVGLVGGLLPALRAARMLPVVAMRT
jgi:putative ABC transport system permease protein